jgi:alpha-tubulin suppressor-like RCC1 family protein
MERMTRRSLLAVQVLLASLALMVLTSCPNPLLDEIKNRVAIHQRIEKPDILVKQGDVVIGEDEVYVYANADVVTPEDVVFTIWNEGKVNLFFKDPPVVITGNEEAMFFMPDPFTETAVAPGQSCTLTLRFQPEDPAGTKSAVVNIYSDDPDENPYNFNVRGTIGTEIDIKQGDTLIESGSYTHAFDDTYCDAQHDVAFTVSNPGTTNLDLGTVSLSGTGASQFSVIGQPAASVAPRASTSFTLRFQPNTPGSYTAGVSLSSNDPDESPYIFTITGDSMLDFTHVKLSAGYGHSVALKSDGTVCAWGNNNAGEVGDGTTTQRANPRQVSGLSGIVTVSAGWNHTLAVKNDGTVWAWGANYSLQLGDGTTENRTTPIQVLSLAGIVSVAAGQTHSLALKNDGTVWAWGNNQDGALGIGDFWDQLAIVQVKDEYGTGPLTGVTAIAAGGYYSLARKGDGTVWAWGRNTCGQLGDGDQVNLEKALPVQVLNLSGVTAIAAGPDHAAARKANGEAWAWGSNTQGQLGDSSTSDRWTPVRISNLTDVAAVGGGHYFTVLRKANGEVWSLGYNASGQLGNGGVERSLAPVQALGLMDVDSIGVGFDHTLAVIADGTVWAWGSTASEKLGDGTSAAIHGWKRLTPVQIAWLGGVTALAAGGDFTVALRWDGTVWTWGNNGSGQLGDGTVAPKRTSPVQAIGLSNVIAIAAGDIHSVALKNDGTVWTWGNNALGQLGHSEYPPWQPGTNIPTQLPGLSGVTAISARGRSTAALLSDGTLRTWGYNSDGQLGDGTTDNRFSPVTVAGMSDVTAVAVGYRHMIALTSDGSVWAWGDNISKQLGIGPVDPPVDQSLAPVQVVDLTDVTAIAAGHLHNLALKTDKSVWSWGWNSDGQLGDGTTVYSRDSPVQVGGVFLISKIAAGERHSMACYEFNWCFSWGDNEFGQLGDGTTTDRTSPVGLATGGGYGALALAGGADHTIWNDPEGWIWSCGHNNSGQLGDATSDDRHSPVHAGAMPFSLLN